MSCLTSELEERPKDFEWQSLSAILRDERTIWTNLRAMKGRAEGELTYNDPTGGESAE
ncbi:hypothetical protein ACFFII_17435 [Paracoccus niistensis]|uniref:Uncharacterized protein n=1 Tax=Paracoccus niistensis TaxID=632935 RepID=A0ABV6I8H2_9RHOB